MREGVPLAPFTTFQLGGPARHFVEVTTTDELKAAAALARCRGLPIAILGAGSNILVPDEGVDGLVIKNSIGGLTLDGDLLVAGAGVAWDAVVDFAAAHELWGIENLAGIPGTVGGAVVQNIGAYGAALSTVFEYADTIDLATGAARRFSRAESLFGYRDSVFKKQRNWVLTRVALTLRSVGGVGNLTYQDPSRLYKDIAELLAGLSNPTPEDIAAAVRRIRRDKFPDLAREGTAGSFFANPILPQAQAEALKARFPGLPLFPLPESSGLKVPAGWLIDHVLKLRGYVHGGARIYEQHALVLVAARGAAAREVEELARIIEAEMFEATGIRLEREVEKFSAHAI